MITFASSRRKDFPKTDDYYDLWVFDEFNEPENDSHISSATEMGSAYAHTLQKVLDRQECRLDSKYGRGSPKRQTYPLYCDDRKYLTPMCHKARTLSGKIHENEILLQNKKAR